MWSGNRRRFLQSTASLAGLAATRALPADDAKQRVPQVHQDDAVEVLYPRDRVPLSFIIDDSTCLVNMGHFCMPQFAECYPDREGYKKPWKDWPREIPDAFVREFGEWCAENGVKGKYSIVPNPACVGWLDRELPGWSRKELQSSLKLVRNLMLPNWDIHPEMITHTRVIDLKTGRPMPEISPATMENSYPREKKSVDELAAYLAYALRILKSCDLPCEGVTTPGGFGNLVKSELSLAVQQAVRDVYSVEIPHYFKYVNTRDWDTEARLEHLSGVGSKDIGLTVNVPAGTGDWFGGWEGDREPEGHRYSNDDASGGRMVELIEAGVPALMLCHWPGMYCNGTKSGFRSFQKVVLALNSRFRDETIWMKLSEIARYEAAKGLTEISSNDGGWTLDAPFACPQFTLRIKGRAAGNPIVMNSRSQMFQPVRTRAELRPGFWLQHDKHLHVCLDLPRGRSSLVLKLNPQL